jgi:hypothetical protein
VSITATRAGHSSLKIVSVIVFLRYFALWSKDYNLGVTRFRRVVESILIRLWDQWLSTRLPCGARKVV